MAKIPDFSKFDLQGVINSVKSVLSPESGTPVIREADPIGTKIVEISRLLQTATEAQDKAAHDLKQVNTLLNGIYKDIETIRDLGTKLYTTQEAAKHQAPPKDDPPKEDL